MTIGLSGILSLIAEGRSEQSDLFEEEEWGRIRLFTDVQFCDIHT